MSEAENDLRKLIDQLKQEHLQEAYTAYEEGPDVPESAAFYDGGATAALLAAQLRDAQIQRQDLEATEKALKKAMLLLTGEDHNVATDGEKVLWRVKRFTRESVKSDAVRAILPRADYPDVYSDSVIESLVLDPHFKKETHG